MPERESLRGVPSGLWADAVDVDVETYLNRIGRVFRAFREHDSGYVSYGVLAGGKRWLVKHSSVPRAIEGLKRALVLHAAVLHPALPALPQLSYGRRFGPGF